MAVVIAHMCEPICIASVDGEARNIARDIISTSQAPMPN